jgi:hypothetical protein
MPVIRISVTTTDKLKKLAVPLEDSFDSVISRLADAALQRKLYNLPISVKTSTSAEIVLDAAARSGAPPMRFAASNYKSTMDETQLYELLGKIGKRVFVSYFRQFGDERISNQQMIAMLPREYTFKSRTSRTSKSRRIFREGLELEALALIAQSNRVDADTADLASRLIREINNLSNH